MTAGGAQDGEKEKVVVLEMARQSGNLSLMGHRTGWEGTVHFCSCPFYVDPFNIIRSLQAANAVVANLAELENPDA